MLSTCPFVLPSVCHQSCEHGFLIKQENILLRIGKSGPRYKGMKRSTSGACRSKSRSQEAEIRFGGLAEASFWTPWGRVAFLDIQAFIGTTV